MSLSGLASAASNLLGFSKDTAQSESRYNSTQKSIAIKQLFIHPIKSCRGISVESSEYDEAGLKYDRTWLIVDNATKRFCTARDLPQMVLITPVLDEAANELSITIPLSKKGGKADVTIKTPLNPTEDFLTSCELVEDITIWNSTDQAGYAVNEKADTALSEYFGKPVRLVRKGPTPRPSGPEIKDVLESHESSVRREWKESTVRFQDFYPVLLASEASLDHVRRSVLKSMYPSLSDDQRGSDSEEEIKVAQHRVPDAVNREYWTREYIVAQIVKCSFTDQLFRSTAEQIETLEIQRFRPNILVDATGGDHLVPFEEDEFYHLEFFPATQSAEEPPIGAEAEGKGKGLYCMARCARCQVPCIDTETGERDPYLPSRVLQSYRIVDPESKYKPCFGMLSVPRETSESVHN